MKPWVPCDFCGQPGYLYPVAGDVVFSSMPTPVSDDGPKMVQACTEHKWIVLRRGEMMFAPRRAAYREGRAVS